MTVAAIIRKKWLNTSKSAHNSLDIFFRKTRFNGTHQRVVARDRGISHVSLIIAIVN